MFLDILTEERVEDLASTIGRDLECRAAGWAGRDVVVFDELVEVYGAAAQAWAGVESSPVQTRRVSRRLAAIVDGFGGAGLSYPRAWAARLRADRWARRLVARAREGRPAARPGSVLAEIAVGAGADLEPRLAGVELLNILRPTVAVAWPGTFLARDLSRYPQWRSLLADSELADAAESGFGLDPGTRRVAFGHEVRRTCPFVPALAGRAHAPAQIAGTRIERGDLIVLDVPGTNLDPAWWSEPESFQPERFDGGMPDPFAFVPQGGGDTATGHRCPGEPLTVRILAETARVLAGIRYEPTADTGHDRARIPTLPSRGLPVRVRP
jgi:fatty-acid peroxygenase